MKRSTLLILILVLCAAMIFAGCKKKGAASQEATNPAATTGPNGESVGADVTTVAGDDNIVTTLDEGEGDPTDGMTTIPGETLDAIEGFCGSTGQGGAKPTQATEGSEPTQAGTQPTQATEGTQPATNPEGDPGVTEATQAGTQPTGTTEVTEPSEMIPEIEVDTPISETTAPVVSEGDATDATDATQATQPTQTTEPTESTSSGDDFVIDFGDLLG